MNSIKNSDTPFLPILCYLSLLEIFQEASPVLLGEAIFQVNIAKLLAVVSHSIIEDKLESGQK
jgi:hypothetical protein